MASRNITSDALGAAIEQAVLDEIPAAERNETAVVVTIAESAVAVLTVEDGTDADELRIRFEGPMCRGTSSCSVSVRFGASLRRRLDTSATIEVNRTYVFGAAANNASEAVVTVLRLALLTPRP